MALGWVALGLVACQSGKVTAQIDPAALQTRLESPAAPVVLDVRSTAEYQAGHVPGARHIPYQQLPDRLDEVAEQRATAPDIVVYCETGVRASIAEHVLQEAGFERVFHLAGDMRRWRRQGRPIEAISTPTKTSPSRP